MPTPAALHSLMFALGKGYRQHRKGIEVFGHRRHSWATDDKTSRVLRSIEKRLTLEMVAVGVHLSR